MGSFRHLRDEPSLLPTSPAHPANPASFTFSGATPASGRWPLSVARHSESASAVRNLHFPFPRGCLRLGGRRSCAWVLGSPPGLCFPRVGQLFLTNLLFRVAILTSFEGGGFGPPLTFALIASSPASGTTGR